MSLPENIKKFRKLNKMTQSELANKLGVGLTSVSAWETGRSKPLMDKVTLMANLFGVRTGDIVGDNKESITPAFEYNYFDTAVAAGALTANEAFTSKNVSKISLSDVTMGRYASNNDVFVTRVNGDSMDNIIPDNSLIAVKHVESAFDLSDRDIVVFRNGDGLSVKRFFNDKENQRLVFKPDSSHEVFTDIVVSYEDANDLQIYGKVVVYIVQL